MITEKYLRTCNAIHEVEEFVNCALFSKDYDSISLKMSNLALYKNLFVFVKINNFEENIDKIASKKFLHVVRSL